MVVEQNPEDAEERNDRTKKKKKKKRRRRNQIMAACLVHVPGHGDCLVCFVPGKHVVIDRLCHIQTA